MTLPDVRAKSGLLITQWRGTNVEALTSELLALIDEQLVTPLAWLDDQNRMVQVSAELPEASGWGLDRIGERLGFPRPAIEADAGEAAFFDFAPPVYAVGRDSNLYTISISDRATTIEGVETDDLPPFDASLSLVGSIGWMPAAIAWTNDNLYAIQTNGDIHTLATADGAPSATAIRRLSGTTIMAAAVRDGVIWYYSGPTLPGNTTPSLRTYDPATDTEDDAAVSTLAGITDQPVTAMAWWDDTLYLFGTNRTMYSVDTDTGVCTPVPGATLTGSVNAAAVLPLGLADPKAEATASAIYTSDPSGNIGRITLNPFNYQSIASVRPAAFAIDSMARSGPEGTGFDQSRFASALPVLQGRVGIGDEWYRPMLRARARALLGRGNMVDVRAAARLLFDGNGDPDARLLLNPNLPDPAVTVNDGDRYNVWATAGTTATLYSLDLANPASPVATASPQPLGVNPQALAWHNGTLYALAGSNLYTVNTETGAANLATATAVTGAPTPQIRGLASLGGQLWAIARRNNALYRLDPETGSATKVGSDLTVGGTCESIVAHEGALYILTRQQNHMYSISTSDASTTDLGSLPARMFGAASVGGYVYMIDVDGNLRRTRPEVSPLDIEAAGAIGHNNARAMTSQFMPTIQYTDSRGAAYGDIAEQHAAALLGLPAGVANSVRRA